MNKKIAVTFVSILLVSSVCAQEIVTGVSDSGKVESIDMPEVMLLDENELMKDYLNETNLT